MFSFSDLLKGILLGIACVLPGISGGTLAITMGVYETLLSAVSHLFTDTKNSLKTLFPFLLGCLIALTCFTYTAEYLISNHPFPFAMTVGGCLMGGIPALWNALSLTRPIPKQKVFGGTLCLCFFFLTLWVSATQAPLVVGKSLPFLPKTFVITFCLGLLYSITMIIPGVSGSLLLMMFGYYYSLIETAKTCMDGFRLGDWTNGFFSVLILLPFFLGLFLGGFSLSTCITWLFERFRFPTYCAVLGILTASLFTIFHHMGVLSLLPALLLPELFCGLLLFLGSFLLTSYLSAS